MSSNSTTARGSETIVYVAPDSGAGHGPAGAHQCRSLEEAVSKVREIRANSGDTVRIVLSGGRHVILKSVNINEDDSGSEATPLIIEGDVDTETLITGGYRLDGFIPAADAPHSDRLSAESRSKVWACDLRKHGIDEDWGQLVPRFGCGKSAVPGDQPWPEIYYNGTPLTLTRWPFDAYLHVGEVMESKHTTNHVAYDTPGVFSVAESPDLRRWKASLDSGDVWTTGMWSWLWNCSTLPIDRVDYTRGTITHGLPAPYGLRSAKPFYFTNILEELQYPGQYYIDREAGMLYIIPPEGEPVPNGAVVELAYAPAIKIEGCGNRVRHCEIFNSPHHGVSVAGDNHCVELCSFHHLVLEFDDQAPLEMFGNPYYRGNCFRWNSFHHIGGGQTQEGQAGIRLDDYISAVMIYGNVFYRKTIGGKTCLS